MGRLGIFLVGMLACGTAAYAASYDDFARGMSANNSGNSAAAIEAFTSALNAGDLASGLQPSAHFGRALAYARTGNCAAAVTDLDAAITAKKDNWDAVFLRAEVNVCLRRTDAAIADYTAVASVRNSAELRRQIAWLDWERGEFARTATDFAEVIRLEPDNAYWLIWMALAELRAGSLDGLQVEAAKGHLQRGWPAPVLDLYLGKSNTEGVRSEAARGNGQAVAIQQCEADFYIAEWHIVQKDIAAAKPLLESAISQCPHNYVEYEQAKVERERIGK